MSNAKSRKTALRAIGSLYSRAKGCDLSLCFYCGFPREALDHVPPLSVAISMDMEKFRRKGGRLILFPSCGQCNSMLGSKKLGTALERINYLWAAYATLIEKTHRNWTRAELHELGRGLRGTIEAGMRRADVYVLHLRGVEGRLLSAEINDFALDDEQMNSSLSPD